MNGNYLPNTYSRLGDIRDIERSNVLVSKGIPRPLADLVVEAEQDPNSWDTEAYDALHTIADWLVSDTVVEILQIL